MARKKNRATKHESPWGIITHNEAVRRRKQLALIEEQKIDIDCKCLECQSMLKKVRGFVGTFFSPNESLKSTRFGALSDDLQKNFNSKLDIIKHNISECQTRRPKDLETLSKKKYKKSLHQLEVDNIILRINTMWNSIVAQELIVRNIRVNENKDKHKDYIKLSKDTKRKKKEVINDKIIKLVEVDKIKLVSGSHIPKFDSFCGDDEFTEEDRKKHQIVWLHRSRKIKDPSKCHATDREILLTLVASWCDDSSNPDTFKLMPKIVGNKHNRAQSLAEDPNSVVLCCKCPKDGCGTWMPIHGIIRRLFACPPHFKTKNGRTIDPKMQSSYQKYISRVRNLERRVNLIDNKKHRDIRYNQLIRTKPEAVSCLYCDTGIGLPIIDEYKKLQEYFREQNHIRVCDRCDVLFCCKLDKTNKVCGERYFAGEPYVEVEEKSNDPKIDHRKKTCLTVKAIRDEDSDMIEITKNTRECPKCRHGIELIEGCNSITCKCGEIFCWLCGKGGFKRSDDIHRHILRCSGARGGDDYYHIPTKTAIIK
jgi:hypothetical protein